MPYSRSMSPLDTGEFQIGPFEFVLNNIKYKSDSIKIRVIPPLPEKEGIYISSAKLNDKTIVIIEQVYKFKTQFGMNYSSGSSNLVDIYIKDFNNMISQIKESSDSPLKMGKSYINNNNLHYSIKSYEITNYTSRPIRLTRDNFLNLPADYILPDIEIK
jgi:hypothetical protein